MAHIVAFSPDGPRGTGKTRTSQVNDVENLMLLCPQCHKLIDEQSTRYSVETLKKYKATHERRVKHLTSLGPDLKTTVVQLKARIAGQTVAISINQVTDAVAPRYPNDPQGCVIDLTNIAVEGAAWVRTATQVIKQKIDSLYEPGMDVHETRHVSLFALAPIPILVYLGRRLSNKVPLDVYQRHRDTEDWVWKTGGTSVDYRFEQLRAGTDMSMVALLLSLSGKLSLSSLPAQIDERFSIYELTLADMEPTPTFLRMREDLAKFKDCYQTSLRSILRNHRNMVNLHLFPAIPAPVAVLCGREVLPKVDPVLQVYDYDKRTGGFHLTLEVN